MTEAPNVVEESQLEELGIVIKPMAEGDVSIGE